MNCAWLTDGKFFIDLLSEPGVKGGMGRREEMLSNVLRADIDRFHMVEESGDDEVKFFKTLGTRRVDRM